MMISNILSTQEKINSELFWLVMGIGFFATGISIIAFLPQSLKIIKTKKTNGISIITFTIYTFANTLWFIWGILDLIINGSDLITILKDTIIITANIPCALWAGIILTIKIYNIYYYGENCKKWKGKKTKQQKTNLSIEKIKINEIKNQENINS